MPTREEMKAALLAMSRDEQREVMAAMGPEKMAQIAESLKAESMRDELLGDATKFSAEVQDWAKLKAFVMDPEGAGKVAQLFGAIKVKIAADIEAEDAAELFRDLLMLYKAVK